VSWSTASARRASHPHDEPIADVDPRPPHWVDEVLGPQPFTIDAGPHVRAISSESLVLLTAAIAVAPDTPAETLRSEVTLAYRRLQQTLASIDREPIRFWNFVPAIGAPMGDGLDRYMVFNAGRHDAFAPTGGADQRTDQPSATASAVGVTGAHLVVHCLASARAGIPVENPRQVSSWRYSARYGPKPPRFSRATIATMGLRTALLIGGTASIVGEQSLHQGDTEAQFDETLRNLAAVVAAAGRESADPIHALTRIVDLRAYVIEDDVARFVRGQLAARCPNARRIEIVRARLCRPELLVEIEGVADI
jgi:chorismate lyase / 3-hydroxybenzoate synthase